LPTPNNPPNIRAELEQPLIARCVVARLQTQLGVKKQQAITVNHPHFFAFDDGNFQLPKPVRLPQFGD
jgi:hypothetical protein